MITLLYVDDDPACRSSGRDFLEKTGEFSVDTAASAEEARALSRFPRYDAIVSAYGLPGMDGIAFLGHLRHAGVRVPFILVPERGSGDIAIRALDAGADLCLRKDGDREAFFAELAGTITALVRRCRDRAAAGTGEPGGQLFAEIFTTMKGGAAIYEAVDDGADFVFRDFNHAAARIDRIQRKDVLGRRVTEVFPGIREFGLLDVLTRVWRTGKAENHPVSLYHDSRIAGWRDNYVYRLASGQIFVIYADLTAEKQEEEKLRFATMVLQTQLETSPEAILIVDEDGRVVRYNQTFARLWNIPDALLEEGIDEPVLQYVTDQLADPAAFLARVRYLYDHREEKSAEELALKDGRILERFSSPMLAEDGRYYGRVWYFRDITGRRKAEETVKKSEEKYRLLADAAKDFIYIIDRDDTVVYVNQHGLSMIRKSLEEVTGKPRRDLFPKEAADRQFIALQRVFESGKPARSESMVPMPGGMTWQDTYLVPLTSDDGTVAAVMGVSRDITERKQAEEQLRAGEEKLRTYIENSPVGIFVIDGKGNYIDANDAACRLTGYRQDELLSMSVSGIVPDENRAGLAGRFAELLRTGRLFKELKLKRKDGSIISIILDAVMLKDGTSIAFCTDITERRRNEDLTRETLERYRLILKNAKEGILINEMTPRGPGTFIEFNESACAISGMSGEELKAVSLIDLDTPGMQDRAPFIMQELKKKGHVRFQTRYITPDKQEKYIEINTSLFDLSGRATILSVVRDITDEKRAQLALEQANRKLNLLTGITRHDIKNQLLSLNAYLALARDVPGTPGEVMEFLACGQEIAKTIERQILFTREYEDLGVKAPQWQNVEQCITNAVTGLDLTGIAVDARATGRVEILADSLLGKVFFNLADNSLRHGGETLARIWFTYRGTKDGLVITCEDDGVGIPADDKEAVFERGFGKNTGFGLFFIREILAITGITIRETGEPGMGARFEILVPNGAWRQDAGRAGRRE